MATYYIHPFLLLFSLKVESATLWTMYEEGSERGGPFCRLLFPESKKKVKKELSIIACVFTNFPPLAPSPRFGKKGVRERGVVPKKGG